MDTSIAIGLLILNILCGFYNTMLGFGTSSGLRAWLGALNWLAVGALIDNVAKAFA